MSCEIDFDYDNGPECFSETWRTARKEHMCCECGRKIQKGEKYKYESGIWEGRPESYKLCKSCHEVRSAFFCNWTYGCLWDDFEAHCTEVEELSEKSLGKLSPETREKVIAIWDSLTSLLEPKN